ncbi:MAG: PIN domain-containing protein [Candidatus Woesearchaeota archaeon]
MKKKKKKKKNKPKNKSIKIKIKKKNKDSNSNKNKIKIATPTKNIIRKKNINSMKNIETQIKKALPKKTNNKNNAEKNIKNIIKFDIKNKEPKNIIILDTNFLFIPSDFKIDIFDQITNLINASSEIVIFDKTIYELQKLSTDNSNQARSAKLALQLINKKHINVIITSNKINNNSKNSNYVDDIIANYNEFLPNYIGNVYIATQDKELKNRLKQKNCKIISMTGKKKISLI